MLHWIWNAFLDELFDRDGNLDWHWNMHSSWNSCISLYNLFHGIGNGTVEDLLYRHRNIDIADPLNGDSNRPLYKLFHRIRHINPVRNRNFIGLSIWSVDRASHRVWNGSRNGFLNWNGIGVVDVPIDRIRHWNARWYIYGVCHVHSMLDVSINRNRDLSVNIPFYWNGFGPLHQQCPSPRKRHH
jgi:hypothetical protein